MRTKKELIFPSGYTPENLGYFSYRDFIALAQLVSHGNRSEIDLYIFCSAFYSFRNRQVISVRYRRSPDGVPETLEFEPHKMAQNDGVWYLAGKLYRPEQESVRMTLALHRISELDILPITFTADPEISDIDAPIFSWKQLPEVRLKVYGHAIQYALEYLPYGGIEFRDGTLELTLYNIDEFRVRNFVLLSAGNAIVTFPDTLKENITRAARGYLVRQDTFDRLSGWLKKLGLNRLKSTGK